MCLRRLLVLIILVQIVRGKVLKTRQRRYVGFPEGSTFIVTLCLTHNILLRKENIFLEGINWGISYDLPNSTSIREVFNTNIFAHKRRQRRDLYNRMEGVLENMGFGGKHCTYRALCESSRINPAKTTLAQDLFRRFFTYPMERLSYLEPDEHRKYHWASRFSSENSHLGCRELFPDCTLSIIDMVFAS